MRDQAAHVIDKGKKVALAFLAGDYHQGAVHGMALPDVIGEFGLELATVGGDRLVRPEQSFFVIQAINGGRTQNQAGLDEVALVHFQDKRRDGGFGHLSAQVEQGGDGVLIQGAGASSVVSWPGAERFELAPALLIAPDPGGNGGTGETRALGEGDLPGSFTLLPQQPFLFSPFQVGTVDEVADDSKTEYGDLFLLLFVHGQNLL